MNNPWIKEYQPASVKEMVGQQQAAEQVLHYVKAWSRSSKPLWIWGNPGSGKTSLAVAVAKQLNLELLEINASDSRNAATIKELVGGALKQGSLFGTSKLILIDEVDGLSGTKDRGAMPTLIKLFKKSAFPIIITGQDPYNRKYSSLRKACELVELKVLEVKHIAEKLKEILDEKKIEYTDENVNKIARSTGGDLRAAINDAQTLSTDKKLESADDYLGTREQVDSIQNALLRVFKTTKAQIAKGAYDNVQLDVGKIMLWVDQNLPSEYTKTADLQAGFDALSVADMFMGRIRRWQYYRYYVYIYDLLTAGIAIAKDQRYPGVTKYKETTRLLQIWMAKQRNAKKKAIAEKMAVKTHCSTKRALENIPFLQHIATNNQKELASIASFYDLNEEEVNWLRK